MTEFQHLSKEDLITELTRLKDIESKYKNLLQELENKNAVVVDSKHNDWKPTQHQPSPYSSPRVKIDPTSMDNCYQFFISAIVPRPIALVSSCSKDGQANLAPFSYFGAMGHDPPIVAIGITTKRDGTFKDSLNNISETGEFVVNIMNEWYLESANYSCGPFPKQVDEFVVSGLTKSPSVLVNSPTVKESACSMECKVRDTYLHGGSTVVIAEVVQFHVPEEIIDRTRSSPTISFEKFKPMGRLGGVSYGRITECIPIERPGENAWKGFHPDIEE